MMSEQTPRDYVKEYDAQMVKMTAEYLPKMAPEALQELRQDIEEALEALNQDMVAFTELSDAGKVTLDGIKREKLVRETIVNLEILAQLVEQALPVEEVVDPDEVLIEEAFQVAESDDASDEEREQWLQKARQIEQLVREKREYLRAALELNEAVEHQYQLLQVYNAFNQRLLSRLEGMGVDLRAVVAEESDIFLALDALGESISGDTESEDLASETKTPYQAPPVAPTPSLRPISQEATQDPNQTGELPVLPDDAKSAEPLPPSTLDDVLRALGQDSSVPVSAQARLPEEPIVPDWSLATDEVAAVPDDAARVFAVPVPPPLDALPRNPYGAKAAPTPNLSGSDLTPQHQPEQPLAPQSQAPEAPALIPMPPTVADARQNLYRVLEKRGGFLSGYSDLDKVLQKIQEQRNGQELLSVSFTRLSDFLKNKAKPAPSPEEMSQKIPETLLTLGITLQTLWAVDSGELGRIDFQFVKDFRPDTALTVRGRELARYLHANGLVDKFGAWIKEHFKALTDKKKGDLKVGGFFELDTKKDALAILHNRTRAKEAYGKILVTENQPPVQPAPLAEANQAPVNPNVVLPPPVRAHAAPGTVDLILPFDGDQLPTAANAAPAAERPQLSPAPRIEPQVQSFAAGAPLPPPDNRRPNPELKPVEKTGNAYTDKLRAFYQALEQQGFDDNLSPEDFLFKYKNEVSTIGFYLRHWDTAINSPKFLTNPTVFNYEDSKVRAETEAALRILTYLVNHEEFYKTNAAFKLISDEKKYPPKKLKTLLSSITG